MITWIVQNLGTIVVSLILLAIIACIVLKMIRDKKKGRSSCGCNCAHCNMCAGGRQKASKQ